MSSVVHDSGTGTVACLRPQSRDKCASFWRGTRIVEILIGRRIVPRFFGSHRSRTFKLHTPSVYRQCLQQLARLFRANHRRRRGLCDLQRDVRSAVACFSSNAITRQFSYFTIYTRLLHQDFTLIPSTNLLHLEDRKRKSPVYHKYRNHGGGKRRFTAIRRRVSSPIAWS